MGRKAPGVRTDSSEIISGRQRPRAEKSIIKAGSSLNEHHIKFELKEERISKLENGQKDSWQKREEEKEWKTSDIGETAESVKVKVFAAKHEDVWSSPHCLEENSHKLSIALHMHT